MLAIIKKIYIYGKNMKNIKNFKISPFHIVIFISILAIIIFTIIQLTDKSNFLHIDLNNENLIKTSKTKTSILFK